MNNIKIKWVFNDYMIFPIEIVGWSDDFGFTENGESYGREELFSSLADAKMAALSYAENVIQKMWALRADVLQTDESQFPLTNPDFYNDIF